MMTEGLRIDLTTHLDVVTLLCCARIKTHSGNAKEIESPPPTPSDPSKVVPSPADARQQLTTFIIISIIYIYILEAV